MDCNEETPQALHGKAEVLQALHGPFELPHEAPPGPAKPLQGLQEVLQGIV